MATNVLLKLDDLVKECDEGRTVESPWVGDEPKSVSQVERHKVQARTNSGNDDNPTFLSLVLFDASDLDILSVTRKHATNLANLRVVRRDDPNMFGC